MIKKNYHITPWVLVLYLVSVAACSSTATTSDAASDAPATASAPAGESGAASSEAAAAPAAASDSGEPTQVAAAAPFEKPPAAAKEDLSQVKEIAAPPPIVESCKKEPFSKWEAQSRAAIKAGWEATKEEKYGIGFKTSEQYKQWSETHNLIFKSISNSCDALSKCAKKHGKNKSKACAKEAGEYRDWQTLVKKFTDDVEAVKVTQLDELCGIPLSLNDSQRCFEAMSKNVSDHCQTEDCGELAQCWQNLAFMKIAFIQAETACRYSHIKLSKCRGYIEQETRRKEQIQMCEFMQKKIGRTFLPVL